MVKRLVLASILVLAMVVPGLTASLDLRASWTANTEPDMKEYKLYRTDGLRTLIGTVQHPTVIYDFSVIVPDGSAGALTFVLTAVDTNNNESADSAPASYSYNTDVMPPAAPRNLGVVKR